MAEVIQTENFVEDAVERIASAILKVHEGDRRFRLSLCGGGTPKPIYEALAKRKDIDWSRVLVTFGDERCVGPEDEASNYRMAREALLKPAGVPNENVVRIEGEREPKDAARVCEARLRDLATATGESATNGGFLVSSSNSTTPAEYRSLRASTVRPCACSGDR